MNIPQLVMKVPLTESLNWQKKSSNLSLAIENKRARDTMPDEVTFQLNSVEAKWLDQQREFCGKP